VTVLALGVVARRTLRRQDEGVPKSPPALDPDQRAARGRDMRRQVPRSSHEHVDPASRDAVNLLVQQSDDRVADLVPLRYARMLTSPFAFLRGSAVSMAHDLAGTPSTGLRVQCCGDAHLANFGLFASPERHLLFDVNDFDETLPAPWEWDVKRLAASIAVASRDNGHDTAEITGCVLAAVASYRHAMRTFAEQSNLDVWYARVDADQLQQLDQQMKMTVDARERKNVDRTLQHARASDQLQAFTKLTIVDNGALRFKSEPPILVRFAELVTGDDPQYLMHAIANTLHNYGQSLSSDHRMLLEQYRVVDVARKVVGVGSVGTRCYVALLLGRDMRDPLFLQVKEAEPSVLEAHTMPSTYAHHGHRVVAGQRLMQAASDIFLGWHRNTDVDGSCRDYYVRQLRDGKASIDICRLTPIGMKHYGEVCAWTLARAHARSGDRIAIAAYLGRSDTFDQAIARFAAAYADLNLSDYAALQKAAADGRIPTPKPVAAS
jgi:uncharacterized protein (DUF2252 family)